MRQNLALTVLYVPYRLGSGADRGLLSEGGQHVLDGRALLCALRIAARHQRAAHTPSHI